MGQPNVLPATPRFHRIQKQTCVRDGNNYRVELEIFKEDPAITEVVTFIIPEEVCNLPLTIFRVGLHTDYGWTLFYETETQVMKTQKIQAVIPSTH